MPRSRAACFSTAALPSSGSGARWNTSPQPRRVRKSSRTVKPDRRRIARRDQRAGRMRAHLVEEVEQRDLLRAGEARRNRRWRRASTRGSNANAASAALRAQKARVARLRFVDQRLQQMAAAAAGFAPDVEGAVGHRAGRERAFQLAQPRHQFGVAGGEEIVECGEAAACRDRASVGVARAIGSVRAYLEKHGAPVCRCRG